MNVRTLILGIATLACLSSIAFVLIVPAEEDAPGAYAIDAASVEFHKPKPAGELTLTRLDGTEVTAGELSGKVVVLDVWATWCAPCISEIPHYNELVERYADEDVELIGVTVQSGSRADVERFLEGLETPIEYSLAMGNDAFEEAFGPLWALPTTYLIDPDWQLRRTWMGVAPVKQAQLRVLIDRLLDGA